MVISFKKLLCIFLLIICAITFFMSTCSAYSYLTTSVAANERNVIMIIDPGHGGEDGGAVANDGTIEKDINLSISKKLQSIFLQNGFDVVMTREDDIAIYDDGIDTLKEKKTSDMKNRLEIYNSSPQNVIISIHQNKFEQSQYNGTQIFYSKNNADSEILANSIKESVVSNIQPENTRECKEADKNIYLLYNAENPAVIVECGFISNEEDLSKLKNDQYQSQLAIAIFNGFLQYYNN